VQYFKVRKLSEIPEIRKRPRYKKDQFGKLHRYIEEYKTYKQVPTINGKERVDHYFTDSLIITLLLIPVIIAFIYFIISFKPTELYQIIIAIICCLVLLSLISSAYYIYYEYRYQQTPGKKVTKSVVVDEYGNKPSLNMIIKRTLLRLIPYEPLSCIGNPSYGLHDKWSKTYVIKKEVLNSLLEEINKLDRHSE